MAIAALEVRELPPRVRLVHPQSAVRVVHEQEPVGDDATGGRSRLLVRFDDPAKPSFRPQWATDGRRFYFTINDRQSDIYVAELHGLR